MGRILTYKTWQFSVETDFLAALVNVDDCDDGMSMCIQKIDMPTIGASGRHALSITMLIPERMSGCGGRRIDASEILRTCLAEIYAKKESKTPFRFLIHLHDSQGAKMDNPIVAHGCRLHSIAKIKLDRRVDNHLSFVANFRCEQLEI